MRKRTRVAETEAALEETVDSQSAAEFRQTTAAVKKLLEENEAEATKKEERLEEVRATTKLAEKRLEDLRANNQFVVLLVGGERFEVPIATLLKVEGTMFQLMLTEHFSLDLDSTNAIVIDRDPTSFRVILNYLRGYRRFSLSPSERALVESDVDYYGVPELRGLCGLNPTDYSRRILPGPGVNTEGTRLRVAYSVATVGETMLLAGRHQVTFEVLSGEYLGIGLCSEHFTATDMEFHKTLNCCVYYMTGVFYSNFPAQKKEENLEKFGAGNIVSVILDMDHHTIEYIIRGVSAKVVHCGTAPRLRVVVVAKLNSGVRIVPNEYAQCAASMSRAELDASNGGTMMASPAGNNTNASPPVQPLPPPPPPPPPAPGPGPAH